MSGYLIARFVKMAIVGAIALVLFGLVVMWLWNWLMPAVFGVNAVTFWQALGLLALSWILFGGFRGSGHHHRPHGRHHLSGRWAHMTPEEREQFREKMHDHWHRHGGRHTGKHGYDENVTQADASSADDAERGS